MSSLTGQNRASITDLRRALRSPAAIGVVAQEGADDPARLALLSHARPESGELPVAALEEYCICLTHAERLDPALARFALPMCLDAWQRYLFEGTHGDLAMLLFHRLAGHATKLEESMGATDVEVVRDFMRVSILSRLSTVTSLQVNAPGEMEVWVDYLAGYGTVWADFSILLRDWCSVSTIGLAIAAIQYLSLLVYEDAEHPLFQRWADRLGGAAPLPWAGKDVPWLRDNVSALQQMLQGTGARDWMARAVDRLKGHADESLARLILDDMDLQPYRVESRTRDLAMHMATPGAQKYWSDVYGIH